MERIPAVTVAVVKPSSNSGNDPEPPHLGSQRAASPLQSGKKDATAPRCTRGGEGLRKRERKVSWQRLTEIPEAGDDPLGPGLPSGERKKYKDQYCFSNYPRLCHPSQDVTALSKSQPRFASPRGINRFTGIFLLPSLRLRRDLFLSDIPQTADR